MLLAGTATQNHNKIQKLMDRGIPVASKYLQKVWLERDKQAHEKKKASMKAAVDNKTPPRQPHLECRSKKLYEANERLEQINRENHILLRRIDYHNELRHPARIDCHLKQQGPKSLNILMREKRVREIEAENQRIHRQISSVKPTHSVQKLEADYIRSRKDLEHLSEYPPASAGMYSYQYDRSSRNSSLPSVRTHRSRHTPRDDSYRTEDFLNHTQDNNYTAQTDDDDTFDTECFKEQVEAPQPPLAMPEPQETEYKEDYDAYDDDDFAQDIINKQPEVRGNTFLTDDIAGNDNNDIF